MTEEKQRTVQQNKALHLYFRLLAELLNEHGLDMRTLLKPGIEIPWNAKNIKEFLWRPIQKSLVLKSSTTELTTKEIDIIYETLNRAIANHGVHIPFPSLQEISISQIEYENRN